MNIRHFLCENHICAAGGEARRLVLLGWIKINDTVIDDIDYEITDKDYIEYDNNTKCIYVKKSKKVYCIKKEN